MPSFTDLLPRKWVVYSTVLVLVALVGVAAALVNCGGSGSASFTSMNGTGTINVSITDPPSCKFPNGSFQHVYVTIISVRAHINPDADDSAPGWQELVPQLMAQPIQIDLFSAGAQACLLTTLGSNTGLPAGTYQQIRLILLANDGSNGLAPAANSCGNQGFNCVVLRDGSIQELQLSSQAHNGLKILPGIAVMPGQDVNLNIDFNACASILHQGNGQFRLKPVLKAEEVSTNNTGISGKVVDSSTGLAIVGGTVIVALEQPDATGADAIFMQTAADPNGNFNFCPLPANGTFDVVVVAINGAGVAYNATIAVGVLGGTALGTIPLIAESGASTAPATLQGFVTATTGTAPATADAAVTAEQIINLGNGMLRPVAIPAEGNSTPTIMLQSNTGCPAKAPMNTNCAQYTLIEPASNPSVGIFAAGQINYAAPLAGDVLYTIRADASTTSGATDCVLATMTTSLDTSGNPLKVTAGATVTPMQIDFTGCS